MIIGGPVQFKRRPGLEFRWSPGVLVSREGRTCVVRAENGAVFVLLAKLVRDVPRDERPARVRAPLPKAEPRTVRAGASSGKPTPKVVRYRDEAYLAWVRTHACCVCAAPGPSDPHHFGPRGMAQKSCDLLVVPLCRACHDHVHAHRALRVVPPTHLALEPGVAVAWLFDRASRDLLATWLQERAA